MEVAVTGSVAFDHIMSFGGRFQDHILADKIHALNVSFLVNGFEKRRGGCAANIAYSCALHEVHAGLVAAVGHDFGDYGRWLAERGVDLSGVLTDAELHTASCFITTDRSNNQITGFYPGAMVRANEISLKSITKPKLAVISPNDPGAMRSLPSECRELGIDFMFDPGQQVIALDADALRNGLRGARIVIANDYELAMMEKTLGIKGPEAFLEEAEMLVLTLGAEGSKIYARGQAAVAVPVAPIKQIEDPTGCGDAYRGGLIAGLLRGAPLEVCGRLGALTAAYCIEVKGTSEYSFTRAEFAERYKDAFKESLCLPA